MDLTQQFVVAARFCTSPQDSTSAVSVAFFACVVWNAYARDSVAGKLSSPLFKSLAPTSPRHLTRVRS